MIGVYIEGDSVNYTILISSSPFMGSQHQLAMRFIRTALENDHSIERIFFYGDAVLAANRYQVPPQGQKSLADTWADFASELSLSLHACIANSVRRGIVDQREAERYNFDSPSLHSAFTLAGLGEMSEVVHDSDKMVQF